LARITAIEQSILRPSVAAKSLDFSVRCRHVAGHENRWRKLLHYRLDYYPLTLLAARFSSSFNLTAEEPASNA
jgi:hypothetical protein